MSMSAKRIVFSVVVLLVGLYPFGFKDKVHAKNFKIIIESVPGVSWGAVELKDPKTDEIVKAMSITDLNANFLMLSKGPDGCMFADFRIERRTLDFEFPPIYKIDKNEPVNLKQRQPIIEGNRCFWRIGLCNKDIEKQTINQLKRGKEMKILYFVYPGKLREARLPLKGFTKAYNWMEK